jgi:hypothetical protein
MTSIHNTFLCYLGQPQIFNFEAGKMTDVTIAPHLMWAEEKPIDDKNELAAQLRAQKDDIQETLDGNHDVKNQYGIKIASAQYNGTNIVITHETSKQEVTITLGKNPKPLQAVFKTPKCS